MNIIREVTLEPRRLRLAKSPLSDQLQIILDGSYVSGMAKDSTTKFERKI